MSKYRKIDVRIHNDAKYRALSERGKLVFFTLMTHPNLTMVGAMRATVPGLAAESGIDPEGYAEAFQQVLDGGMAKHDTEACFLWLPNFLKYNLPESPNVVKSWPKAFDWIPECAMRDEVYQSLKAFIQGLTDGFIEAFNEAFHEDLPKSMANQRTENREQRTENRKGEKRKKSQVAASDEKLPPTPPVEAYEGNKTVRYERFEDDAIPSDADRYQLAPMLLEQIGVVSTPQLYTIVVQCIELFAKEEGISEYEASARMVKRANADRKVGISINRFWFEDGKFRQVTAAPSIVRPGFKAQRNEEFLAQRKQKRQEMPS